MAWGPLPVLGGDNRAILQGLLGLSDQDYADLEEGGHISLDYVDAAGDPL